MLYVGEWVHDKTNNNQPIPQAQIIKVITKQGSNKSTIVKAINQLLNKGYIRRGVMRSRRTYYVQTKSVSHY
jgi:ABC-type phosphate/phosphonate transport system ATPase subunit